MLKKIFILLFITLVTSYDLMAQSGDFMRSIGKIYVVIAVIVAIFIGIIIYLISMERKIKKIENIIKNER